LFLIHPSIIVNKNEITKVFKKRSSEKASFRNIHSMDNTIPLQLLNEHLNFWNVEKAPSKR